MLTYNHKGERIPDHDCDNFPVQIDVRTVKEILRDLPPVVNSQPKMGRWIDECTCSVCRWIHENSDGFAPITDYSYCPNCGAKMEVEE